MRDAGVVRYTRGFTDEARWVSHFDKHGHEFGVETKEEYLRQADVFLGGPLAPGCLECIRGHRDRVRYHPLTEEFGVLTQDKIILTYFIPDPAIHGLPTNRDYFEAECRK